MAAHQHRTPRYLRFAQALALGGGAAAALAGCYASHVRERAIDAGPRTDTPIVADAGRDAGRDVGIDTPPSCHDCGCCVCGSAPPPAVDCLDSVELSSCCLGGPYLPPDLPAGAGRAA